MTNITSFKRTKAQPQETQSRNRLVVWLWRGLLGLLACIVILTLVGAIYQAIATAMAQHNYPPPGRLVEVGGYKLHLYCTGEGSPTVILEAAFPGTVDNWSWVQPEVAKATRTCAYDRAGMGWSDLGPEPHDAEHIASDLHTLLNNAGIEGPYVFVGHSLGGLFVRQYTAQYPGEVVGLVLVDGTHPDVLRRLPPELAAGFTPSEWVLAAFPLLARVGLTRFYTPFPADPDLPAQQQAEVVTLNASVKSMTAIAAELRAIPTTLEQVRGGGDLGNMPLVVLTSGDIYNQHPTELVVPAKQAWAEMQDDLADLSSNSIHRVIAGTTHESLVYDEEDAQSTIAAILEVVEVARTGQPLAR
jgi:pimeloyl-ACP methyl ester carboxylesterase